MRSSNEMSADSDPRTVESTPLRARRQRLRHVFEWLRAEADLDRRTSPGIQEGPTVAFDADDCYVVLVLDLESDESDAFGPLGGINAILAAARVRHGLDSVGLHDMDVTVTRLHQPIRAETGTIWAARAGTSSAP
jgi:hypothetical protein